MRCHLLTPEVFADIRLMIPEVEPYILDTKGHVVYPQNIDVSSR